MNKYLVVIILMMGSIIAFLVNKAIVLDHKLEISENNTLALSTGLEEFKINDSIKGVKISGLTLQVNELKEINSGLQNDAKELGVKNRNLESLVRMYQNQLQNNKDTVFVHEKEYSGIKIQKFEWCDPWTSITGKITDGNILPGDLTLEQKDTLKTATEIKYKRFWYTFWKRTPVGIQFKAYNTNPHKQIKGVEYVKLK